MSDENWQTIENLRADLVTAQERNLAARRSMRMALNEHDAGCSCTRCLILRRELESSPDSEIGTHLVESAVAEHWQGGRWLVRIDHDGCAPTLMLDGPTAETRAREIARVLTEARMPAKGGG